MCNYSLSKYFNIKLFNSAVLIGLGKYSSKTSLRYISLIPVIALAVNATTGGIVYPSSFLILCKSFYTI